MDRWDNKTFAEIAQNKVFQVYIAASSVYSNWTINGKNPNEGRIQIQHTLLCKKLKKGNIFGWWQLHACLSSSHSEIRKFLSSQYALSRKTELKG